MRGAGPTLDLVEQLADLVLDGTTGAVGERGAGIGHRPGVVVVEIDLQPTVRSEQPPGLRPRGTRLRVGRSGRGLGHREPELKTQADDAHNGAPGTPLPARLGDHGHRHPTPLGGAKDRVDKRDCAGDLSTGHRHRDDAVPMRGQHAPLDLTRLPGQAPHPLLSILVRTALDEITSGQAVDNRLSTTAAGLAGTRMGAGGMGSIVGREHLARHPAVMSDAPTHAAHAAV